MEMDRIVKKVVYSPPVPPHRKLSKSEAQRARFHRERWMWDKDFGPFRFDIYENINTQCLCLGISLNWNFRPSIEVSFGIWTMHLEYDKPSRKETDV
jgi:hypothetical protein